MSKKPENTDTQEKLDIKPEEKGSFVEKPEDTAENKVATEGKEIPQTPDFLANVETKIGLLATALSGVATTLVTIKVSIDENTKVYAQTRDKLEAILKILVVDGQQDAPPQVKKEQPKLEQPTTSQITTETDATKTPPQKDQADDTPPTEVAPDKTAETPLPVSSDLMKNVTQAFPEDLATMLLFEDKPDHIFVKPKEFLGSENFAKIASVIRQLGGEYVSAGRDSHFRVYKK